MATPQDYLNLVAAIKTQPANKELLLQLQQMLAAQPELVDTRADDPLRYYHHNTVMQQWPEKFLRPRTEEELIALLEANKNAFTSFRAMGDGYGFANASATTGCLVQTAGMNDLLPLEAENFDQDLDLDDDEYVRFQAGITFGKLNDALALANLTVCQQPGFRNLTVAGCASAGGHGSGIGLYGISGWIQAVELAYFDANKNVKIARVEPSSGGLTDPAKYKATHDPARYELLKDDQLFHSVRCAQGHLGIITALTMRVRPRYNLKEDRWVTTWDDAWAQLPAMFADPLVHAAHVWINPYSTDPATPSSPTVLITRLTNTEKPPWGVRGIGILFGGPTVLTDIPRALLGDDPGPGIDAALQMCAKMDVRLRSTEALDFGLPNDLAVNSASLGFDATMGDAVVKDLIPQILAWKNEGLLFNSPIGMRWVKASEDFLSPQYGRDTIMLEVPLLKQAGSDTSKNVEALKRYANMMMDRWGGRPHWGQQNPMNSAQFQANYGASLASFIGAMKKFNPTGMFDGPLTAQLGLRALAMAENGLSSGSPTGRFPFGSLAAPSGTVTSAMPQQSRKRLRYEFMVPKTALGPKALVTIRVGGRDLATIRGIRSNPVVSTEHTSNLSATLMEPNGAIRELRSTIAKKPPRTAGPLPTARCWNGVEGQPCVRCELDGISYEICG